MSLTQLARRGGARRKFLYKQVYFSLIEGRESERNSRNFWLTWIISRNPFLQPSSVRHLTQTFRLFGRYFWTVFRTAFDPDVSSPVFAPYFKRSRDLYFAAFFARASEEASRVPASFFIGAKEKECDTKIRCQSELTIGWGKWCSHERIEFSVWTICPEFLNEVFCQNFWFCVDSNLLEGNAFC
jgi:hypothetical protein